MKTITTLLNFMLILTVLTVPAQNIEFTFDNTQVTNDGTDDFYETDIMIAAIEELADFKLGSGLLYINYNTAAFGSNIATGGVAQVSYPVAEYILSDINILAYYSNFLLANNTASRIAFSFQQGLSSGGMTTANVTATPKKLFHLRIKFLNAGLDPMIVFEDNETPPSGVNDGRDQFYTACGPDSFAIASCASPNSGSQFLNAIFTSTGATLSNNTIENPVAFAIYPNPATDVINIQTNLQLTKVEIYNMLGKRVLNTTETKKLQVNHFNAGVYFLKAHSATGTITKKIMIE